jgi:hypothetical protein
MKNNILSLQSRDLTSQKDFEKFVEIYCNEKKGVETSIGYLKRCSLVRIYEDITGKWQGGYCINQDISLRYFEPFDETLKKRILKDKNLLENEIVEISQIWMNREVLLDEANRMNIYLSSVKSALDTNKHIIIGGSKVASVWKSYELIMPHELFFGLVPFPTGYELGKIVYTTDEELVKTLEKYKSNYN